MGTLNPNGVYIPAIGEVGWGDELNTNLGKLSDLVGISALDSTATSNTTALQAYLDALPTLTADTGPTTLVHLPPGTFDIQRPVRLYRKAVRLLGNDTTFRWTGPAYKTISTATHSGTTVTITTSASHGFTTGDLITIAEITESLGTTPSRKYNGTFAITSTGATTFTYVTNSAAPSVDGDAATGYCGYSMFIMEDCIYSGYDNIYFQGNTTTPPIALDTRLSSGGILGTNALGITNACRYGSWYWSSPTTFSAVAITETSRYGVLMNGIDANGDKWRFHDCSFYDLVNGFVLATTQNVWSHLENPHFEHISNDAIRTASNLRVTNPAFVETRGWEIKLDSSARVDVHNWNSEGSRGYATATDTGGVAHLSVYGGNVQPPAAFGSGHSFHFPYVGPRGGLLLDGFGIDNSLKATPDIYVRGVEAATTTGTVTIRDCPNFVLADLDIVSAVAGDGGTYVEVQSRDLRISRWLRNGAAVSDAAATFVGGNVTNGSGGDPTTGGTVFTTGSVSPTTGRLILLGVTSTPDSGVTESPTVTGLGLTWVEVDHSADNGTTVKRTTLYRAMGTVTPGVVTITFAGAQWFCEWNMAEFVTDTSGTNGSGGIVQAVTDIQAAGTSLTITLAAFEDANDATYATFGIGGISKVPTAGSGFTIMSSGEISGGAHSITQTRAQEWKQTSDTSVDISWTGSAAAGGVAVELRPAPTAQSHVIDTTDAHDASAVSVLDTDGWFAGTNVETVLAEIGAYMDAHP